MIGLAADKSSNSPRPLTRLDQPVSDPDISANCYLRANLLELTGLSLLGLVHMLTCVKSIWWTSFPPAS